ncbi:hypothetical protein [Nocardia sp. XZ_19_385]|uniref:hypothetical protein n=1 Tax=Nocardia sp. XZ_19_385 TaxID=2769488 RepID=UPI00188DEE72|nr:hypothetical protein [Nocardia sp. XZ_19_385]
MSTPNNGQAGHWSDWLPAPTAPEQISQAHNDGAEIGSTVSDDAHAVRNSRHPGRSVSRAIRRHTVVIGASVAVAATVAGIGLLWPDESSVPVPAKTASPSVSTTASVPAAPRPDPTLGGGPGCEPTRTPNLLRGNGTGSLSNGPDAILAFEHAYYTQRSGTAARAATTPDAAVPTAQEIDAGIGTLAPGTAACVVIIPAAPDLYRVSITETGSGGEKRNFTQLITTTNLGGSHRITGITAADS